MFSVLSHKLWLLVLLSSSRAFQKPVSYNRWWKASSPLRTTHSCRNELNVIENTTLQSSISTNDWHWNRRSVVLGLLGLTTPYCYLADQPVASAFPFQRRGESKLFFINANKNASESIQKESIDLDAYQLNSELCLLKLLPVKNPVFRGLERTVIELSSLKNSQGKILSERAAL